MTHGEFKPRANAGTCAPGPVPLADSPVEQLLCFSRIAWKGQTTDAGDTFCWVHRKRPCILRHQVTMTPESQANGHHIVMCCSFCHFLPTFLSLSKLPYSENSVQEHPLQKRLWLALPGSDTYPRVAHNSQRPLHTSCMYRLIHLLTITSPWAPRRQGPRLSDSSLCSQHLAQYLAHGRLSITVYGLSMEWSPQQRKPHTRIWPKIDCLE